MLAKIKHIDPSVESIITSAYDEKKYLLKAIKNSVSDYMMKPLKIDELIQSLTKVLHAIHNKEDNLHFNHYLKDMVHHQQNLLVMVSKGELLFANHMFLSFFGVKDIGTFNDKYGDLGRHFIKSKGFLYNQKDLNWFTQVQREPHQLFHINLKDQEGKIRHFILKMDHIPEKKDLYILSMSDITQLNLLTHFEDKKTLDLKDTALISDTILNLLNIVLHKKSKIKLHNFYNGLAITNIGYITEIEYDKITIKTSHNQLKAIQFQDNMLISGELFPNEIFCEKVLDINFSNQTMQGTKLYFLQKNSIQRKSTRVVPREDHTVYLELNNQRFQNDMTIKDISVDAIKIECKALPVGLKHDSEIIVHIILENSKVPLKTKITSKVLRIDEKPESFFVVLIFDTLLQTQKKILTNYVARRQMQLIQEFKGLQYEPR